MVFELESYYAGKRVFVTGAAGFIGSHLVERLADLGAEVTALVRYNSRNDIGFLKECRQPRLRIFYGDIRERDSLPHEKGEVDVVLHLASIVSIPYSYVRPEEVVDTNVSGTLNALLAARELGVSKFVQVSSSEVYGSAVYVPIDERHPRQPQSVYAASKIAADALALGFHHSYGMPVAICRPFNTYGPRQSDRAVIPTIIAQALRGQVIRLGNISTSRDFTYVSDTVEGILAVAASDDAVGRDINLGSGKETSIADIVRQIGDLVGKSLEVAVEEDRVRPTSSEVTRLLADNGCARKVIGWKPVVALDEGLRCTIDWISARRGLYDPGIYRI